MCAAQGFFRKITQKYRWFDLKPPESVGGFHLESPKSIGSKPSGGNHQKILSWMGNPQNHPKVSVVWPSQITQKYRRFLAESPKSIGGLPAQTPRESNVWDRGKLNALKITQKYRWLAGVRSHHHPKVSVMPFFPCRTSFFLEAFKCMSGDKKRKNRTFCPKITQKHRRQQPFNTKLFA